MHAAYSGMQKRRMPACMGTIMVPWHGTYHCDTDRACKPYIKHCPAHPLTDWHACMPMQVLPYTVNQAQDGAERPLACTRPSSQLYLTQHQPLAPWMPLAFACMCSPR